MKRDLASSGRDAYLDASESLDILMAAIGEHILVYLGWKQHQKVICASSQKTNFLLYGCLIIPCFQGPAVALSLDFSNSLLIHHLLKEI